MYKESEMLTDIRKIIVDHNVRNSSQYLMFRLNNGGYCDGKSLPSAPWTIEKKTAKQFFNEIFPDRVTESHSDTVLKYKYYTKKVWGTLQEHYDYVKKHNITSVPEYRRATKSDLFPDNLYTVPWATFKMSTKEFFSNAIENIKEVRFHKRKKQLPISDVDLVKLCIENKLTNSRKWRNFYVANPLRDSLVARPWDRFFVSEAVFFEAVRRKSPAILERFNAFEPRLDHASYGNS
jgi:hypothetical protein